MGTTSRRGAITKFQEGLNGNTRDALIGCESDLFFDSSSSQYIPITLDSRYNFGTGGWSVSRFVEFKSGSANVPYIFDFEGGGYFLQLIYNTTNGNLSFVIDTPGIGLLSDPVFIGVGRFGEKIHFCITRNDNIIKVFVNSVEVNEIDIVATGDTHDFGNSTTYLESARVGLTAANFVNGTQSHISWFSKTLTQDEIEFMHSNGGIIPESLHPNVIAHYPMTERTGLKLPNGVDNQPVVGDEVDYSSVTVSIISGSTTDDATFISSTSKSPAYANGAGSRTPINGTALTWQYDFGSPVIRTGLYLRFWRQQAIGAVTIYGSNDNINFVEIASGQITDYDTANLETDFDYFVLRQQKWRTFRIEATGLSNNLTRLQYALFDDRNEFFADVVQQYNYAKSLDQWLQSDGGDPGTFVNYTTAGWSFSTDGNGKITLDVVGSPASPHARYSLANSGIPINTPITVKVKVTSSVLDSNFFSVQLSKGGEGSALFDVTTSGTYEFEHTFTNVAGPANVVTVGVQTNINADVGDYVQFEIVEQYIAGQRVIDTPNHAKAINFTPDELGITNPSTQTAKKDFYNKDINKNGAFFIDGTLSNIQEAKTVNGSKLNFNGADFTVEIEVYIPSPFNYPSANATDGILGIGEASGPLSMFDLFLDRQSANEINLQIWDTSNIVTINGGTLITSNNLLDRWFKFHITYDHSATTVNLYGDGKLLLTNNAVSIDRVMDANAFLNVGNRFQNPRDRAAVLYYNQLTIWPQYYTANDVQARLTNQEVSTNQIFEYNFYNIEGNTVKDLTANPLDLTLNNFAGNTNIGGGTWLEKQSLLPEIKQALAVQSSSPQRDVRIDNFTPSNENGYTFIHVLKETDNIVESGDVFFLNATTQSVGGHLYFQRDSNLRQYGAGISASVKADVEPYNLDQISVLAVQYNPSLLSEHNFTVRISLNGVQVGVFGGALALDYANSTDSFQIGVNRSGNGNWLNGHWIADLGFKRILSNQEIKSIAQNILSTNTLGHVDWSNALFYYQRNEGSFYDDGSFVRIKNLMGTEEDAYIEGLTGATSADQLADVPNHLVAINSLR